MRREPLPGDLVSVDRSDDRFHLFGPPWEDFDASVMTAFVPSRAVLFVISRLLADVGRAVTCDYLYVMILSGKTRGQDFGWIPTAYAKVIRRPKLRSTSARSPI